MSFSNMIQDALSGHGHSNNNNNNNNRHDDRDDDDFNPAVRYAESHTNTSDPSLFTSALSFLNENKHRLSNDNDIDEQKMINAHQSLYGGGESERRHDSDSVGAGPRCKRLRCLRVRRRGRRAGWTRMRLLGWRWRRRRRCLRRRRRRGGGKLLFRLCLGFLNGDKQSAINAAAEMALKMYLKSGGGGMAGTGGPGGGLLQLASKFL
ncbi:uncharacterized protein P174DRAFT_463224 [Aspergillus novofumigatus IBT 16806]|uniref:DUF7721 domain-containing protein n=1 Tax=Aspergillus novofumigatus (strain IBT 16806) TaxID=1392255 RepID=A0A2I1C0B6_ASPN1|nr:uncharacterized protein P174DRAFT_463224 [Aspergillus novofumigatus IBT 16806]PKX91076.1 hypothetical protein P174DRAFT_463224 [Aspergillus novofumigatus IBT 16806]